MNTNPYYLKTVLDNNATIIEFECSIRDVNLDPKDIIGENWFDIFIDNVDKENVLKVFNGLFENTKKWETYKNDIIMGNQHKFINFSNEIIIKNGEQFISSIGTEYIDNC